MLSHTYRIPQANATAQLDGPAIALAQERARAERHVIECILADPPKMLAIADGESLTQWDFGQPDHRILFLAARLAADCGRGAVLRLARAGLMAFKLWDGGRPRGSRAMMHSDATLSELATAEPANRAICRFAVRRLRRIVARQRRARRLLIEARRLMEGRDAV